MTLETSGIFVRGESFGVEGLLDILGIGFVSIGNIF